MSELSLATLINGGAIEMFDEELRCLAENILDPNTVPDAARKITLTLTIRPDADRNFGAAEVAVATKLAPFRPQDTVLFFDRRSGHAGISEHNTRQADMFAWRELTERMKSE